MEMKAESQVSSKKKKLRFYEKDDLSELESEVESEDRSKTSESDAEELSDDSEDDIQEITTKVVKDREIATSKKRVKTVSTTSTKSTSGKAKKSVEVIEIIDRWHPKAKSLHCTEGVAYVSRNPVNREIFDWYMTLCQRKNSNYVGECQCCGVKKSGSSAKVLRHFGNKGCNLKLVPESQRDGLADYLADLVKNRGKRYGRNTDTAKGARQPNEKQISEREKGMEVWCMDAQTRREFLRQTIAKFFVACNLPASLGDHPFFRDMLIVVANGHLRDADTEAALNRKSVTKQMDDFATSSSATSKTNF
jgi:hypothetical protein